jgi:hypothetical protein
MFAGSFYTLALPLPVNRLIYDYATGQLVASALLFGEFCEAKSSVSIGPKMEKEVKSDMSTTDHFSGKCVAGASSPNWP